MKINFTNLAAAAEIVLASVLIVGLVWGHQQLRDLQQRITTAQAAMAMLPQQQIAVQNAKMDLKKYEPALQRLMILLPRREAVGDIVARIENEANKQGLKAIVADVKEEVRLGKDNKPIAQSGPYQEVRFTVQSYGDPIELLQYLHSLEHLPYVLKVPEWHITTQYLVLPSALTISVPAEQAVAPRPAGLLEAAMVLTIIKEP